MTTKAFNVPNINCGHCTNTIEMELSELEGVSSVRAEVDTKQVTVTWDDPATWDGIQSLLAEIEFPPAL